MPENTARLKTALADSYVIERELGQGGMATVYLAHDVKHDRKVAVKVLRPELAAVLGAERFLNEIKVTANLQHPHILPLHDSGETDSFLFYGMPEVDGESLQDRLDRDKQLPVPEAVAITQAVASALDYAHRHGVVHRDIKPGNILMHDGQPVVADFGIALAVTAAGGQRITETGLSLGTPHYMSPEQATADRELTGASDQYALACVAYEMLTGDPPHTGSTAQAIVAKILTEVPPPVTVARHTVPSHVDAALQKALEKLPADRFETSGAFGRALGDAEFAGVGGSRASVSKFRPAAPLIVLIAAIGIVAGALGMRMLTNPNPGALVGPLFVSLPLDPGHKVTGPPTISPDGRVIAYPAGPLGGVTRLYLRKLDEPTARPVTGSEDLLTPFFSPDGSQIAFFAYGALWKASVEGGDPIRLVDATRGFGGTWGTNDSIIFAPELTSGLRIIAADGTGLSRVTTPDPNRSYSHINPQYLPGNKAALFLSTNGTAYLDLESGEWHMIAAGQAGRRVASGHLLLVGSGSWTLRAVAYSGGPTPLGRADVPVLDGFYYQTERREPWLSVSNQGTLVYAPGNPAARHLVWVDREGRIERIIEEPGGYDRLSLSPDGNQAAVLMDFRSVAIVDLRRGSTTQVIPSSDAIVMQPVWSSDGARVLFSTTESGDMDIYSVPAQAGGTPELVLDRDLFQVPEDVWEDGTILVRERGGSTGADLYTLAPGGTMEPLRVTPYRESQAEVSPNGRWIAFSSTQSGRSEIYVQRYPGPGDPVAVSTGGGVGPQWSWDGTELFYLAGSGAERALAGAMTAVTFVGSEVEPRIGEPQQLFTGNFLSNSFGRLFAVAPDGRFVMILPEPGSTPDRLDVVFNWFDVLRERVGN